MHIHTLTCGWGITPVCSVRVQLLTGSGLSSHQVVARVAHVGGSGANSPSSQCDCAECWVVQLATDCCRERHNVQFTYSMHYSLVKGRNTLKSETLIRSFTYVHISCFFNMLFAA